MSTYKLYCFAESGNAFKVGQMLAVSGADWEPVRVDYFNGETRTPQYRQGINEQGEVPVLEMDGKRYTQSGAILPLLAERLGKFGPANDDEAYEINRWILFDNHKFTNYIATNRFLQHFMKTGETEVTKFMDGRIRAALKVVDNRLATRDFIATDGPSIADFSLTGYLFYGDELTFDLAEFKNITAWCDRIKALPNWQGPYDLMPSGAST